MSYSQTHEPPNLTSILRGLIGRGHPGLHRIARELRDVSAADNCLLLLLDGPYPGQAARAGPAIQSFGARSAFHHHAMAQPGPLVVDDATEDWRFRYHPLVLCEPFVRAYAGQAVRVGATPVGVLCALAAKPASFASLDLAVLTSLTAQVEDLIDAQTRSSAAQL